MRLSTAFLLIAVVVILGLAGWSLKWYADAGEFREIEEVRTAECRPVLGLFSSEDIEIELSTGMAYISADRRRPHLRPNEENGGIFGYSLQSLPTVPEHLTEDLPFDFHPHGLGLHSESGRLFVVNHRRSGDSVEIFRIGGEDLEHIEAISGDLLYNANDVFPVGERNFYVTRDQGSRYEGLQFLERFFRLRRSSLLFFDGEEFREAASGFAFANGVVGTEDGRLFVADTIAGEIRLFQQEGEEGRLTPLSTLRLRTGVDNLNLDDEGLLWVGAHPKLFTFVEYAGDRDRNSPSQVLRIRRSEGGDYLVRQVYSSRGEYLSGSSAAAVWRDYLLIGSVFDQRFLLCELNETEAPIWPVETMEP